MHRTVSIRVAVCPRIASARSFRVLGLLACLLAASDAAAHSVWSGLTYTFTKPASADPTDPAYQDPIADYVVLTRGGSGGLYNIADEEYYTTDSPAGTLWATDLNNDEGATISATNWESLLFDTFTEAYGGIPSVGTNIVDRDAVVYLIGDPLDEDDDIYLDLRVSVWTNAHNGAAVIYQRAEPPASVPEPAAVGLLLMASFGTWLAGCWRRR